MVGFLISVFYFEIIYICEYIANTYMMYGICSFMFRHFDGFNDFQKKKQKVPIMQSNNLKSHSQTLLQLASRQFCLNYNELNQETLAVALNSYSAFLDTTNKQQQERKKKNTFRRVDKLKKTFGLINVNCVWKKKFRLNVRF